MPRYIHRAVSMRTVQDYACPAPGLIECTDDRLAVNPSKSITFLGSISAAFLAVYGLSFVHGSSWKRAWSALMLP